MLALGPWLPSTSVLMTLGLSKLGDSLKFLYCPLWLCGCPHTPPVSPEVTVF